MTTVTRRVLVVAFALVALGALSAAAWAYWTAAGSGNAAAPVASFAAPAANAIVRGAVTVSSDSADADSGVASARFQHSPAGAGTWTTIGVPDTTAPYAVAWDTTGVVDGLYDLRVTTVDNVGNAHS